MMRTEASPASSTLGFSELRVRSLVTVFEHESRKSHTPVGAGGGGGVRCASFSHLRVFCTLIALFSPAKLPLS